MKVRKLVRKFKTNDPFTIAKGLNINIRYADFDQTTRGIYAKIMRRRFIVINQNLDGNWQRFVCAHELGHDRLHPGINRFWLDDQSFYHPGKFEMQANEFAIRLLTEEDHLQVNEPVGDFLARNGVPSEMFEYYERGMFNGII